MAPGHFCSVHWNRCQGPGRGRRRQKMLLVPKEVKVLDKQVPIKATDHVTNDGLLMILLRKH